MPFSLKYMNFYIIPGYGETIRTKGYARLISAAKKKYSVVPINLQLQRRALPSELIEKALKIIGKDKNAVICGFSTGALFAYLISKRVQFSKGIFCSVTTALGKDSAEQITDYKKYLGAGAMKEFNNMRYGKTLARKAIFICGSEEGDMLVGRTKKLVRANSGKLIVVPGNDHEFNNTYVDNIISTL